MIIADIQWYPYRIPFRHSFTTAHGAITVREGMIVEITTEEGIVGTGEIAPLPEWSGANLAAIQLLLPVLKKQLLSRSLHEALSILDSYTQTESMSSSMLCGIEIALLDALGKV